MIVRAKAPELHLLRVLDLLRVAVTPLNRDFGVGVGVYEDVEGAVAVKHGEEGYGCGDLSEDSLNFVLDLFLGFLDGRVGVTIGIVC